MLDKAQADLKVAERRLRLATANAARLEKAKGSVSVEELQTTIAQREVADANRLAAQAAVDRAQLDLDYTSVTAPISGQVDRIYVTEGNLVTGGTSQGTVLTTIVSIDPIHAYFDVDEQTVLFYRRLIREGKFKSAREGGIPAEVSSRGRRATRTRACSTSSATGSTPGPGRCRCAGCSPTPARRGSWPRGCSSAAASRWPPGWTRS